MKEENKSLLKTIAELSTLGLTMVFATFIGLAIGLYLDSKLNTSPWLTILFLIIGIAAGFYKVIQVVIREARKKENNGTKKDAP
ncbi:MAG: AtpZ/AtpI family protein [Nitrospirota bacterium]